MVERPEVLDVKGLAYDIAGRLVHEEIYIVGEWKPIFTEHEDGWKISYEVVGPRTTWSGRCETKFTLKRKSHLVKPVKIISWKEDE